MSFSYYRIFSIPDDAVDRQKVRDLILIRFNFKNSLKAFLETIIPLDILLIGRIFQLRKGFLLILRHS